MMRCETCIFHAYDGQSNLANLLSFSRRQEYAKGGGSVIRSTVIATILLWTIYSGCAWIEGDVLSIATSWTASERTKFDDSYRKWASLGFGRPPAIRWEILAPGDDLVRVALRKWPPDLILGGPSSAYDRLAAQGRLGSKEGGAAWRVVRRSPLGLAVRRDATRRAAFIQDSEGPAPAAPSRRFAFDDPRHDPVALDWAKAVLKVGNWAEGYSRLVRQAGGRTPPGRQPSAALAALDRGEADETPTFALNANPPGRTRIAPAFVGVPDWPEWVEGVAAVRGALHGDVAENFLNHLAESGQVEPLPAALDTLPGADDLLADLLGCSLVEARDELVAAWKALETAGRPERAEMWMTQAPPWPPASVATLLDGDDNAMEMLETLAAQIAPEADLRAWLLRSWISPDKLVDDQFLNELATAVDGRLILEPRFRAWLRGEWTAWARQRYRRVARTAVAPVPHGASS